MAGNITGFFCINSVPGTFNLNSLGTPVKGKDFYNLGKDTFVKSQNTDKTEDKKDTNNDKKIKEKAEKKDKADKADKAEKTKDTDNNQSLGDSSESSLTPDVQESIDKLNQEANEIQE